MNTLKTAVPPYFLLPLSAILLILLGGCAGVPTEVRYDENTRIFSSPPTGITSTIARDEAVTSRYRVGGNEGSKTYITLPEGIKSTSSRYEAVTAHYVSPNNDGATTYSSPPSGVKSRSGSLDGVTAYYTLRAGQSSTSKSGAVQTTSAEQATADFLASGKDHSEQPIVLAISDVLFEFDKSDIKESFFPELNRWVDFFHANPQVNAEIYGHTDSMGSATYNQSLSENRAQAVANYLVEKGINRERLTSRGFGESKPIATNDTQEGRQKNRRVELQF
ncbi:MAG: OmpA family protein [Desulforhopalus sp.]